MGASGLLNDARVRHTRKREAGRESLDVVGELGAHPAQQVVEALGLADHEPVLEHERVLVDRVVAVDQHALGLVAAVVVVQPVDHVRRTEVAGLRIQHRFTVLGSHRWNVGASMVLEILRRDVPLEDVLEIFREAVSK